MLRFLSIFIFILFFTGCIHQIDKQGLTLSITDSQLSSSFDDSFPIKNDFIFGNVLIDSPKVIIPKSSKRVHVTINSKLSTLFTKAINSKFSISGEPTFNKKEASIYLRNVKLEKINIADFDMNKSLSETFIKALQPMINEIFKKHPIYEIPRDSFQGRFVKDIKVDDSKLLVTYGI